MKLIKEMICTEDGWVGLVLVYAALMGCLFWWDGSGDREAKKAAEEGRISAGSDEDYVGENYEAVVDQLETLGFTNVKAIDLDDSGVTFWKADKVESVSIGGDTSFYSSNHYQGRFFCHDAGVKRYAHLN